MSHSARTMAAVTSAPRHAPAARTRLARALAAHPARWALLGYFALTLLFWGRFVLDGFGSHIVAINDYDTSGFMWFYAWWPHALLHGQDPVYTNAVLVPDGYNLAWATSVPGLSLVLAPLTLAFGPVVTFNVVALLAPTLSAWTAFLLCHHVTRALWPSFLGGFLYGFSSYVIVELQGLHHLAFVALVPVAVLLVVRRIDGSLGERRFVVAMTLTLAAQLLVSTEVLLTLGVVGTLVLLAAFLAVPAHRSAIARTAVLLAIACVGVAILASPLLFLAFHHAHVSPEYAAHGAPADLLSWVVPSPTWQALAAGAHPYAGGFGYLGLPLVVLLLLAGAQLWRSPGARVALLAVAIASIASLGASLRVGGHDTGIPLPWTLLDDLPLLRYALPIRLSVFVFLPAAVLVAMWLARGGGPARWGLALLAVVTLLPNVLGSTVWRIDVHDPPFFASGAYRRVLSPSDRVLVLPAAGENMRWQADSKFRFRMVGGGWAAVPPGYARQPIWWKLALGTATPADAGALRRFVDDRGATAIVLDPTHPTLPRTYRTLVARLGVRPRAIGGVLVYRLRPAPPSG